MQNPYEFRPIKKEELWDMFLLIRSRVEWMDKVGIKQWNTTDYEGCYPLSYYEGHRERGEVFVLVERETGVIMSAAVLKREDDRWRLVSAQLRQPHRLQNGQSFPAACGAARRRRWL